MVAKIYCANHDFHEYEMANFTFVKADALLPAPGLRVLKKADYEAFNEAGHLIAQAKTRSGNIIQQAHREYEAEKKRGYEEGINMAKHEMAVKMLDLTANSVDYFANLEAIVTEIVLTSIRRVLDSFSDEDLVVKTVRKVLPAVSGERRIRLLVCPRLEEKVSNRLVEIMEGLPRSSFMEVVADVRLKGSECVLESELGTVEASADLQFKALATSLQKHFRKKQKP